MDFNCSVQQSRPTGSGTDQDGVPDLTEIENGSNPNDDMSIRGASATQNVRIKMNLPASATALDANLFDPNMSGTFRVC